MLSQRRIAACLNLSISESKLKFVYTAPAGWFRARREEDVGGGLFAGGWDQVSKHSLWNPIAAGALKWRRWDLRREATSAFTAVSPGMGWLGGGVQPWLRWCEGGCRLRSKPWCVCVELVSQCDSVHTVCAYQATVRASLSHDCLLWFILGEFHTTAKGISVNYGIWVMITCVSYSGCLILLLRV